MKIEDVINEDFGTPEAFVTGAQIDPELLELKRKQRLRDEGIDPDSAELVQDFPV